VDIAIGSTAPGLHARMSSYHSSSLRPERSVNKMARCPGGTEKTTKSLCCRFFVEDIAITSDAFMTGLGKE